MVSRILALCLTLFLSLPAFAQRVGDTVYHWNSGFRPISNVAKYQKAEIQKIFSNHTGKIYRLKATDTHLVYETNLNPQLYYLLGHSCLSFDGFISEICKADNIAVLEMPGMGGKGLGNRVVKSFWAPHGSESAIQYPNVILMELSSSQTGQVTAQPIFDYYQFPIYLKVGKNFVTSGNKVCVNPLWGESTGKTDLIVQIPKENPSGALLCEGDESALPEGRITGVFMPINEKVPFERTTLQLVLPSGEITYRMDYEIFR